jgi:hypothetical protein
MLEIAQYVKSGFLPFGNTKTEVDFFLQNLHKLKKNNILSNVA